MLSPIGSMVGHQAAVLLMACASRQTGALDQLVLPPGAATPTSRIVTLELVSTADAFSWSAFSDR